MKKAKSPAAAEVSSTAEPQSNGVFYFSRDNFRWMLIGLGLIALGFILMMGRGANTTPDGTFDPNYWNDGIFSFVRIRLAPMLVITGFAVEVYAILKRAADARV